MQYLAMPAFLTGGKIVGLVGRGREGHTDPLPGVVREVRVEHFVGLRKLSAELRIHLRRRCSSSRSSSDSYGCSSSSYVVVVVV